MENITTRKIIGAAIEVHRRLGPGLLESTYEMCLAAEFQFQNIAFKRQCSYPLTYRDIVLDSAYRIDLLVEGTVVVEIKAVESLSKNHVSQLLTYLRLLNLRKGLLLNFNVPILKDGIQRVSNEKNTVRVESNFQSSETFASSASLR
jgi:GxxExxY protein